MTKTGQTRLIKAVVAVGILLSVRTAGARELFIGADRGTFGTVHSYEGHNNPSRVYGQSAYRAWPDRWAEGYGPISNWGHSGDVERYGADATDPGHFRAAFVPDHRFLQGAHGTPRPGLFLYRDDCSGWY